MKRICTVLLSAALCLTLALPAAAAETAADPAVFTDAASIEHWDAVATLTQLGVISGKTDGSFDPAGNVTRGEAAKLITFIMNGGEDLSGEVVKEVMKEAPTFSDIQGHWAEEYIEYCADLGIVNGDGLGAFAPDGDVTALAFLKMALAALGYDPVAYQLTGSSWAVRADELARYSSPSLYEGFSGVSMNGPASRDTVAQLLYNALRNQPRVVKPVPLEGGGVDWQFFGATDFDGNPRTLLQERFGLDELPAVPAQPGKQ